MSELEAHEEPSAERSGFVDPLPALRRAAVRAREIARQTNTPVVIVRDGRIVYLMPDGTESNAIH